MSCKVFAGNGSLDSRDAHALSPVEGILGHFLWEAGPMNVTIKETTIIILSFKFAVTLISSQKIGCMINK